MWLSENSDMLKWRREGSNHETLCVMGVAWRGTTVQVKTMLLKDAIIAINYFHLDHK